MKATKKVTRSAKPAAKQASFTLSMAATPGSYRHDVRFSPRADGTVVISEVMHDPLMGSWMPDGGNGVKICSAEKARDCWRELFRRGYRQAA